MKKTLIIIFLSFFIFGCTQSQYQEVVRASSSDNVKLSMQNLAKNRAIHYAQNPQLLKQDLKSLENIKEAFSNLTKAIVAEWGAKDLKEPAPKEYVKYTNNYKNRTIIDYKKGIVVIETIDSKAPKTSLKDAIVKTLLMPHDPSSNDLLNSSEIKLGGEPYLYKEVLDNEKKPIRWEGRATNFANFLIAKSLKTKKLENGKKAYFVQIPMVKKHSNIRAHKYEDIVEVYAKKYKVDKKLILAIIKTESDFNQYAISKSGAVGLMQIMPATAGTDAYKAIYKKNGKPTRQYLFDPKNNIEMGTVYIDILKNRYLKNVKNNISKEYCVISAYNGGSGTVLKAFHNDRTKAFNEINKHNSSQVYKILTTKVSSKETRDYLMKVTKHKKLF